MKLGENNSEQEYINDYCKVENKPTRFITVIGKPEKVVCCTCGYGKIRTKGEEDKNGT